MKKSTILVFFAVLVGISHGFVTTISAHGTECFREDVPKGENVKLRFQVLEGGNLDIDFEILDPSGSQVFAGELQTDGKYDFRASQSGVFKFCFSNHFSTVTEKTLSVDIVAGDETANTGFNPSADAMTPLEQSVLALSQGVQDVKDDQEYMLMRDIAHKSSSEISPSLSRSLSLSVFFPHAHASYNALQSTTVRTGGF